MKKNIWTLILVLAVITVLAVVGNYIIKPSHDHITVNPYDLKIDSIGLIAKDKYCDVTCSKMTLPFKKVIAIAVDSENDIYISGDSCILILSRKGDKIKQFSTESTATALVVDKNNAIYAAFENHIAQYSKEGKLIAQWPVIKKNSYITSLAVSDKQVFAADASAALVYEFSSNGTLIRSFGSKDKKDLVSCFILPSNYFDVAVAPDTTIWIANTGRHKLVNFYTDGNQRSFWGRTSAAVEDFCGCCNPSHFAIMKDGSFITAEKGIVRVKKYDSFGHFIGAIAGPEHFQSGAAGLDIAINNNNEILVLEPHARIIHIFKEVNR